MKFFINILVLCLLLAGCRHNNEIDRQLTEAESLLHTFPDSVPRSQEEARHSSVPFPHPGSFSSTSASPGMTFGNWNDGSDRQGLVMQA